MESAKEKLTLGELIDAYLKSIERLYREIVWNPYEKVFENGISASYDETSDNILRKWILDSENKYAALKNATFLTDYREFRLCLAEKKAAICHIIKHTLDFKNMIKREKFRYRIPLEYFYLRWGFCHRVLRTLVLYKRLIRVYEKKFIKPRTAWQKVKQKSPETFANAKVVIKN